MEVVGEPTSGTSSTKSSAWATPLSFSQDRSTSQQVAASNGLPSLVTTSNGSVGPDSTSDPFCLRPGFEDQHGSSSTPSMLVRSESAPINILEQNSTGNSLVPDLSDLSISTQPTSSTITLDSSSSHRPHHINFGTTTEGRMASRQPTSHPMVQFMPRHSEQLRGILGGNKPPPSRSMSSVELARLMHEAGKSAQTSFTEHSTPGSSYQAGASANLVENGHDMSKHNDVDEAPWRKSVFDMIQDDFPKTPAPTLSSMLSRLPGNELMANQVATQDSSNLERIGRMPSTTSLDMDLAGLSTVAEANMTQKAQYDQSHGHRRDTSIRSHHRRSASLNWTGDVAHLGEDVRGSSPGANLNTSAGIMAQFSGKHGDLPLPSPSASVITNPSAAIASGALPSAVGQSSSTSPPQSLSPTGSVQRNTLPMSSPQLSPSVPLTGNQTGGVGHITNGGYTHGSHYPLPEAQDPVHGNSINDFRMPLPEYEYPIDRGDIPPMSSSNLNSFSAFPSQGYTNKISNHGVGAGLSATQSPNMTANGSFASFPGMNIFPNAFSTSNGMGSGINALYNDAFRGNTSDLNLKNMSIGFQMAALINAQQHMYQMANRLGPHGPLPGVTYHNQNYGIGGTLPGAHMGHGNHLASMWESREQGNSAHRPFGRNKHHYDQYRTGGSHLGNHKRGSAADIPHKARGSRGRRGHRAHDDILAGHKLSDRATGSGSGMHDGSQSRSALLEEFRATSLSIGRSIGDIAGTSVYGGGAVAQSGASGREWQLAEIKDHVVEFATDQHGSRFIQQKLETATREDKDSILNSALPEAQRLMTDVFGNYVVQKLLEHGGEAAVNLIASELEGRMLALSLHMYGCRVVQKALEVLERSARAKLVCELDGHVLKCIRDQNGNHVIQKCVELVEAQAVQFIVDAVQGQAVPLAGHSYGCRVVQRILEHGAPYQKAPIMGEIMSSISNLIQDQYGNYVIQHVVEHGKIEERSIIMKLVQAQVCEFSQHKFASNVVERCLQHGSLEERETLIEILIVGDPTTNGSPLAHLVRDQFGNYVVQRVLDVARPPQRNRARSILRTQIATIKKYSYGKHIISRLEDDQTDIAPNGVHHVHGNGHGSQHNLHRDRYIRGQGIPMPASHGVPHGPQDLLY